MPRSESGSVDVDSVERIDEYDAAVIGCGMAGLSAAIAAAEAEKNVAVLEKAPKERRGGQTQHTAIIRFPTVDDDLDIDFENPRLHAKRPLCNHHGRHELQG